MSSVASYTVSHILHVTYRPLSEIYFVQSVDKLLSMVYLYQCQFVFIQHFINSSPYLQLFVVLKGILRLFCVHMKL